VHPRDCLHCAFDAVLSIFHEIWESDHTLWVGTLRELNTHFMDMLILGFEKHSCVVLLWLS